MRKRLFEIIHPFTGKSGLSKAYDIFSVLVILISFVPLAFKDSYPILDIIDDVTTLIFLIDYLLRWITADYLIQKKRLSFLLYPITPLAVFDFLCILPGLDLISDTFRLCKIFRLFRTLKIFQYSKSFNTILDVIRKQKAPLLTVTGLAIGYILITALIIFNVEPNIFPNFFDAFYWAAVSLTTIGYGDFHPITIVGKVVTIVSSVVGVAIVALPTGIITAGYMKEMNRSEKEKNTEASGIIVGN